MEFTRLNTEQPSSEECRRIFAKQAFLPQPTVRNTRDYTTALANGKTACTHLPRLLEHGIIPRLLIGTRASGSQHSTWEGICGRVHTLHTGHTDHHFYCIDRRHSGPSEGAGRIGRDFWRGLDGISDTARRGEDPVHCDHWSGRDVLHHLDHQRSCRLTLNLRTARAQGCFWAHLGQEHPSCHRRDIS